MKYVAVLALGGLMALVGCKPPQTYEWGNYESSLYTLMKDPTSLDKYGKALQRQIEDGEGSGKVPPGIYAEYGYFLSASNQPGEAIKYYEKEKQRWPESGRMMDKMILNCRSPKTGQAEARPVVVPIIQPATAPASGVVEAPPVQAPAVKPAPERES